MPRDFTNTLKTKSYILGYWARIFDITLDQVLNEYPSYLYEFSDVREGWQDADAELLREKFEQLEAKMKEIQNEL